MATQADGGSPSEASGVPPMPDDALPKSTSSAMPDLNSPNVPRLRARVHKRLSASQLASVSLESLRFEPLQPEDYEEMVALHMEWFPVPYDDAFYTKSVQGEIFTLAACYDWPTSEALAGKSAAMGRAEGLGFAGSSSSSSPPPLSSSSSSAPPPLAAGNGLVAAAASSSSSSSSGVTGAVASGGPEQTGGDGLEESSRNLLGIVTMSTSCEHHADDIVTILGADCATICPKKSHGKNLDNVEDPLIAGEEHGLGNKGGCLAYVLTLGIVDQYRKRGLARELLQRSINYVDEKLPEVQAVYLHVVTYNTAAIQLYESMRFIRLGHFQSFYHLHGKPYDSYLYARYLHGGRPCWKVRLRNFLGMGFGSSWTDWFTSLMPWLANSGEGNDSPTSREVSSWDKPSDTARENLVSP